MIVRLDPNAGIWVVYEPYVAFPLVASGAHTSEQPTLKYDGRWYAKPARQFLVLFLIGLDSKKGLSQ
jgi:hypothetical protein